MRHIYLMPLITFAMMNIGCMRLSNGVDNIGREFERISVKDAGTSERINGTIYISDETTNRYRISGNKIKIIIIDGGNKRYIPNGICEYLDASQFMEFINENNIKLSDGIENNTGYYMFGHREVPSQVFYHDIRSRCGVVHYLSWPLYIISLPVDVISAPIQIYYDLRNLC